MMSCFASTYMPASIGWQIRFHTFRGHKREVTAVGVGAQELSGDLNWKVGSRRPAESVREQWCGTVSTPAFCFYTFIVVRDLR